jgi:transcription elongation factor Elf1
MMSNTPDSCDVFKDGFGRIYRAKSLTEIRKKMKLKAQAVIAENKQNGVSVASIKKEMSPVKVKTKSVKQRKTPEKPNIEIAECPQCHRRFGVTIPAGVATVEVNWSDVVVAYCRKCRPVTELVDVVVKDDLSIKPEENKNETHVHTASENA